MSIIVEDGTGLPNANAYIDVGYADAYFATRGNAEWAVLETEAKEHAIVNATDYIDLRWGHVLVGKKATTTQALEFPRNLWSGIPQGIKRACSEYAVRASSGPLMPEMARDESGFQVTESEEKVGPLMERKKFSSGVMNGGFQTYSIADSYMRPYLGANALGRVIRNG